MDDLATSFEPARSDMAALQKGLDELALVLKLQKVLAAEHAQEIEPLLNRLRDHLARLRQNLDVQAAEEEQLRALFQVSRAVNSTLDLEQVLNIAMDTVIEVTHAQRGFLMLRHPETGELEFQVARNLDRETIASPAFEVSRSVVRRVAEEGQPILTADALTDPRFSDKESIWLRQLRSILCVPLMLKGRVTGAVYVENRLREGVFTERERNLLVAFANEAAVAIENAQLFASVHENMREIAALKNLQDSIFASIASGVMAIDREDCITAFNRAAEQMLGVPRDASLGQPYRQVLPFLSATSLPELIERVKSENASIVGAEIAARHPLRGMLHLSCSISSLTDPSGQVMGIAIVVDDVTERRRLEAVRAMFRRYMAPAVVDRLPANADELALGGHRQPITILFADLRGFTAMSEKLGPDQLVEILNQYLALAANAILEEEGTLDKFMGDAVMGIFNAPLHQSDHTLRAVRAACAMRKRLSELHARLPEALRLEFGIGIHTGEAVVGNIGSHPQMNFTAIGDAVNLAKRLQENAAGGQILLSEDACGQVKSHIQSKELAPLRVKGRRRVERVWELEDLIDPES